MNLSENDESTYRYLVVDSGPIIRRTALNSLWRKAQQFYTVPAVLQEIRDAKAREHLDSLPFKLQAREPSKEAVQTVIDFARQTGDYQSLSVVDLQVLGLLYDLEREGCNGLIDHIRKTPKRMLGVGKVEMLMKNEVSTEEYDVEEVSDSEDEEYDTEPAESVTTHADDQGSCVSPSSVSKVDEPAKPKTWAMLVNPKEGSSDLSKVTRVVPNPALTEDLMSKPFGKMNLSASVSEGQFSDAEDDEFETAVANNNNDLSHDALQKELQSDFPSLSAARLVPYEGGDDSEAELVDLEAQRKADELRKQQSLKPISKSGKLYNSFRGYQDLLKPKPKAVKKETTSTEESTESAIQLTHDKEDVKKPQESRIMGGVTVAGQDGDVEDDGEGWITSTNELKAMKSAGFLDPQRNPSHLDMKANAPIVHGPPISQRAACATTDFAMQNVILQMNLELLSVDGVKVRKLKSWVTRCGACYKIYTNADNAGPLGSKRLFCERCGSDFMQRIAASVDGKTGRLRLHLSKKYKHNLRGTKFSLPKPGTGNRFHGDLLLREDQLMIGAWNQKVKISSGGKAKNAAQSMFGRDIATNVGCHATATNTDIKVGFGRRNPNEAKGRERRGKKKKSTDKACGLRRY
ncbi:RNA-binding protein NOB1 [Fistulifera solaris]|uniref:RNA-binding protein NOB1 n=1 Tax=Fistulifera solaris TaxID=1519565 RepID=A0A1Z5J8K4_FISSO|nr:RNA-binding protein NOB1 [Fistulifera solaris]|eukprot:GAX10279.1 RNA-binding protein NOB1 [Fistulifera solaris]